MRHCTIQLLIIFLVVSCQTPTAPKKETFDDQVVVTDKPDPPPAAVDVGVSTPDMGVSPPDVAAAPPSETFVAKPKLPENMSFQETALARTVQQLRSSLRLTPILEGGCGIPASIRAVAEAESSGYTVDSCLRAVTAAHAMTYQRTITKVGVLDVSTVEIRHDGQPIWSIADDCTDLRQQDNACASDFIARRATTMSFVGPILTYHIASNVAQAGAAAEASNIGFVRDVRTGMAAKFGALIDLDSLRNGLKRHSTMRRVLNPKELDAAKSIDEIWSLWRTQDFVYFGGYYFANWDAENGQAEMRIWYLEDASAASSALKEVAVWVRPKAQWKSAFEDAASERSGFLAR